MMNENKNKRVLQLSLIGLLLLNFFLKILFIRNNSIGGDEPFTIYHAQLSVSSIVHFLKLYNNPPLFELINDSKERKYFIGFVFTNILLLYAHYFGAFVLIIQGLCVLSISRLRKQFLKSYLLLLTIIVILYIPQLKILMNRLLDSAING